MLALLLILAFVAWILWWFFAVDWKQAWPVIRKGGWLPLLMVATMGAYIWASADASRFEISHAKDPGEEPESAAELRFAIAEAEKQLADLKSQLEALEGPLVTASQAELWTLSLPSFVAKEIIALLLVATALGCGLLNSKLSTD